jgi:allophanate hydrolase
MSASVDPKLGPQMHSVGSLDFHTLRSFYRSGVLTPSQLIEDILARIARAGDDHVWISRLPEAELREAAKTLELRRASGSIEDLPLFGLPFAVKDNIDVLGMVTTAGCPDYAYSPSASAPVVERLQRAGALLIGKTNLDQFATGLVGTRSPYGVSRNPFDADFIPGGSSSGSAVAVAAGLVAFALGTDTAGSGRVPAAFNNIVGLKPTRGLVSTAGIVPACRSLDCVSIFALTVEDAVAVLACAQGPAPGDPYARAAPAGHAAIVPPAPLRFRFAIPRQGQCRFFGNDAAEQLFATAVERMRALGGEAIEVDYAPFAAAAELLYGPLVAERTADLAGFLAERADSIHPVTRSILEGGRSYSAVDLIEATHRVAALRCEASAVWHAADILLLPTAGTIYRVAEIAAEPLRLNANLGFYTNFVNLFDLAAVAVPNGYQPDGMPTGVTLIAPAWHEAPLAAIAAAFQRASGLTLGATSATLPPPPMPASGIAHPWIPLAVVGAHLSGMPLNHELATLGARLRAAARTAPSYRLYALPDGRRPGLVRVQDGGAAIAVEIWEVPSSALGSFIARIAPPLGVGTIELDTGAAVLGFICEAYATQGSIDITQYGGWRAFKAGMES